MKKHKIQDTHPVMSNSLVGHTNYLDLIKNNYRENRLAHAWILSGNKAIGKATLGYYIAKELLHDSGVDSLDNIKNCPDLYVVNNENVEDKGSEVTVDDIRKLADFTHHKAVGKNKVIIIDALDDLNLNAANALLKLIEEPQANTYFILISHNIDAVLETVKSRCNILEIKDLSTDDALTVLTAMLGEKDSEIFRKLLLVCNNSPGIAKNIYEHGGLDLYSNLLEILSHYPEINMQEVEKLANKIAAKDNMHIWEIFTFFFGVLLQKIIKLHLKIELDTEIVDDEHRILQKIIGNTDVKDLLFVAETAESLIRSAEVSHLDKKQILVVLLEILRDGLGLS